MKNPGALSLDGCRDLFSALVLQAFYDLRDEPYASTDYGQSVMFFTDRGGPWARWRVEVADMIGLHGDDLMRLGQREIAAREARDPPPKPKSPRLRRFTPAPAPAPAPQPVKPPQPPQVKPPQVKPPRRPHVRPEAPGEWIHRFTRSGLSLHLPPKPR